MGVTVYDLDGRKRFTAFRGRPLRRVEAVAGRLYVGFERERGLHVLDLATGRELARRLTPLPRLLIESADG